MTPDGLRAVEEVVATHPDVQEVAVVPIDGGLAAAVVPVDFASAPDIREHAWRELGDARSPQMVRLLPALPRDAAGQVDVAELRRALAEDDLPGSAYVPPRTPLESEVTEILREVLDLHRVGLDDDFLELGGDSLDAVEVVNLLEQRTGLRISLEDLFEAATVRNLVRGAEA